MTDGFFIDFRDERNKRSRMRPKGIDDPGFGHCIENGGIYCPHCLSIVVPFLPDEPLRAQLFRVHVDFQSIRRRQCFSFQVPQSTDVCDCSRKYSAR